MKPEFAAFLATATLAQTNATLAPPSSSATFVQPTSQTDAALQGNCLSQRIDFSDPSRFFNLANTPLPIKDLSSQIDTSRYDMTIDYGDVTFGNGGATLLIKDNGQENPVGVRIATTRFMRYGKITGYFKAVTVPGIVSSFISAGPPLADPALSKVDPKNIATATGDEIDFELLGKTPTQGSNNVFYRGLLEYSKHDMYYNVPNGIAALNKYTIEWKHDTITFSLNDKVLRTYSKSGKEADSQFLPGTRFFPDRPQKIQMALWADKTNSWSGGLPQWPDASKQAQSTVQYIDITCYDDKDTPVPKWPLENNPERYASVSGQPTQLIGGSIPPTAGPQNKGAVLQPPPAMPSGYTGAANKVTGNAADSGSNDGKTLVNQNAGGNTAQIGKGPSSGAISTAGSSMFALIVSLAVFAL